MCERPPKCTQRLPRVYQGFTQSLPRVYLAMVLLHTFLFLPLLCAPTTFHSSVDMRTRLNKCSIDIGAKRKHHYGVVSLTQCVKILRPPLHTFLRHILPPTHSTQVRPLS